MIPILSHHGYTVASTPAHTLRLPPWNLWRAEVKRAGMLGASLLFLIRRKLSG